jgi:plastocyanin
MRVTRRHVMLGAAVVAAIGCAPHPAQMIQTVHIRAFQFTPAADTVQAGDTVLWVNDDMVPHTATAPGKEFDSGSIDVGASWPHVTRTPGSYAYECTFHPNMRGTLVVR